LVEEVPITLNKLWIFARGHAIHNFFQEHLDETENEIFLSQDFGLFDAIGYVDVLSDNVMYEFKTTQSIPEKPKIDHIMQIQSYYSMLDPEKQSEIKKLCIVYFSLNKIKTYEVPKLNMLNYLEARGSVLANSLKISSPPPREESYICNYCDFKDICFKRDKDL
jgi:CRISPR/Cas system-associated exonuclease Cas4 (RecB family)